MERQKRILIIKSGYSETFLAEAKMFPSLGDVFRTTVLLHLFKQEHVTWLTDKAALPLIESNPYIDRVSTFEGLSAPDVENEQFDKVINLEKIPEICALAGRINAWTHFGFRLNLETGKPDAYTQAYEALVIATYRDVKSLNSRPWAALLYRMLGAEWSGESYVLGYKPRSVLAHDIGFNVHVGKALPVKAWPQTHWEELAERLGSSHTIAWQPSPSDLYDYMNWINSCRLLVTNDSLGMYLGVALGRRVLGIFGPTSEVEQSPHPNLRILTPPLDWDCIPCCKSTCARNDPCIAHISPQSVCEAVEKWKNE